MSGYNLNITENSLCSCSFLTGTAPVIEKQETTAPAKAEAPAKAQTPVAQAKPALSLL